MPLKGEVKQSPGNRLDRKVQAAQNDLGDAKKVLKDAEKAHREAMDRLKHATIKLARAQIRLEALQTLKGTEEAQAVLGVS